VTLFFLPIGFRPSGIFAEQLHEHPRTYRTLIYRETHCLRVAARNVVISFFFFAIPFFVCGAPLTCPAPAVLAYKRSAQTLLYSYPHGAPAAQSLEREKHTPLTHRSDKYPGSCTLQYHPRSLEARNKHREIKLSKLLSVSWHFELCQVVYGRRWVHIDGFLPSIRRSPPFFLKAFTSDASHFNAPYPYRSVGRLQKPPHTL